MASTLRLEPLRFATGQVQELAAGDSLSETTATVLNGTGQKMTKSALGNERIIVTQRLWLLPPRSEVVAEDPVLPPAKRQRKGRRGKGRQENIEPTGEGGGGEAGSGGSKLSDGVMDLAGAELVVEYENKTPDHEAFKARKGTWVGAVSAVGASAAASSHFRPPTPFFLFFPVPSLQFRRLGGDALKRAGRYAVEYVATPALPGAEPLRAVVELLVLPGPPAAMEVSGEGKVAAALRAFALGEDAGQHPFFAAAVSLLWAITIALRWQWPGCSNPLQARRYRHSRCSSATPTAIQCPCSLC